MQLDDAPAAIEHLRRWAAVLADVAPHAPAHANDLRAMQQLFNLNADVLTEAYASAQQTLRTLNEDSLH